MLSRVSPPSLAPPEVVLSAAKKPAVVKDAPHLHYGMLITLRSLASNGYLDAVATREDPEALDKFLIGEHKTTRSHDVSVEGNAKCPFGFVLLNARNERDRSPLQFQDVVVLRSVWRQRFLSSERGGKLACFRRKADHRACKFVIQYGHANPLEAHCEDSSADTSEPLSTVQWDLPTLLPADVGTSRNSGTCVVSSRGQLPEKSTHFTVSAPSSTLQVGAVSQVNVFDPVCIRGAGAGGYLNVQCFDEDGAETKSSCVFVMGVLGVREPNHWERYRELLLCCGRTFGRLPELKTSEADSKESDTQTLSTTVTSTTATAVISEPCSEERVEQLNAMPTSLAEALLVEDLLSCMVGVGGAYIQLSVYPDGIGKFDLDARIRHPSLATPVERILRCCEDFVAVEQWVQNQLVGTVGPCVHALATALNGLLDEYTATVYELDVMYRSGQSGAGGSGSNVSEQLSLTRLWWLVQPSVRLLRKLARLVERIRPLHGGKLLDTLYHAYIEEGDERARELTLHLLRCVSAPYFEMLRKWVGSGLLWDPLGGFQVQSRSDLRRATLTRDFDEVFWKQRFSTRTTALPSFLERTAQKVLLTGKYLNVVRDCHTFMASERGLLGEGTYRSGMELGGVRSVDHTLTSQRLMVPRTIRSSLQFSLRSEEFTTPIVQACSSVSRSLLGLLLSGCGLAHRLHWLKKFFLLEQGDLFDSFLDMADSELAKPLHSISSSKLHSLLQLALRTSTARNQRRADDLDFVLQPFTLLQKLQAIHDTLREMTSNTNNNNNNNSSASISSTHPNSVTLNRNQNLSGFDCFTLSYKERWPLSLVVSKKALTKYQLVFRHLFFCKVVERSLGTAWLQLQALKEYGCARVFGRWYALRHRMLHFVQQLMFYLLEEVIEPNHEHMMKSVSEAGSVDQVLTEHSSFLDTCLRETLLTSYRLMQNLQRILSACVLFVMFVRRVYQATQLAVSSAGEPVLERGTNSLARRRNRLKLRSEAVRQVLLGRGYLEQAQSLFAEFHTQLSRFLTHLRSKSQHTQHHKLTNLYARLTYNSFYSN